MRPMYVSSVFMLPLLNEMLCQEMCFHSSLYPLEQAKLILKSQPSYNLLVHGHHCSSQERICSRCEQSRISSRHSRPRFDFKWPGSTSSSTDKRLRNARRSTSDIEIANKSAPAFEMVLHAKGPATHLESDITPTTTLDIF